ncbi:MAG TPA: hypothetical protein VGQ57_06525 [Polyangiaceae bacterium]|nr:hypothetical protein [Polyangiaceae bacterium]
MIRSVRGSEFFLCDRSRVEPSLYAKYPRLPVLRCGGHERDAAKRP